MTNVPRVKICGIGTYEDALIAIESGAHAIAFNFVGSSKRYINPEKARDIVIKLPPFVSIVGVFADEPRYSVEEIASLCRLQVLQFHGQETPEYCKRWSYSTIKAFRFADSDQDVEKQEKGIAIYSSWSALGEAVHEYDVDAVLIDTYTPGALGGTGKAFDWDRIEGTLSKPWILAGGLNPDNVAEAVKKVKPYGVDVASGVEVEGRKDPARARAFVVAASGGPL
ncbi:phosphoribosylanthranilate isomerase [Heliorestis acidaminivorans]|uniref:N-(5'-phosphoribosyl)anthranilate isomerase n=1 Tax=Heliorestis acidaminivorans TaxID=553427 RepID=A0A6I0EW40_9FIRM|nr:phosphoribosylanthranilate isomerase [Heliorestis acidaminivorans]KAB2954634.1 phosphoribosylanthranilate isomerase [Heliorestis acidaminivorans]